MNPDNFIQIITDRLIIRPVQPEDADAIFGYRSNAAVNRYQGWIPETIQDVHHFIAQKVAHEINVSGTWFQFVVIKKENNELIGDMGIHFMASDVTQVEIGCTLSEKHQGRGNATEALKAMINYLFTELDKRRIIASIDPRNIPSINLFERLEFRKEAHLKECLFINGEWVDDLIYAILKDETNILRN